MRVEPLFIRFANGTTNTIEIINSFLNITDHKKSVDIASKALNDVPDLSIFRKDFRKALLDLIDNGINNKFINYVNSYMKPSLLEIVDDSAGSKAGESRHIILKEDDTPWLEAIVCYNLSLYLRAYGISELKSCPICSKFFSNKGKYAKYCSDICKKSGSK